MSKTNKKQHPERRIKKQRCSNRENTQTICQQVGFLACFLRKGSFPFDSPESIYMNRFGAISNSGILPNRFPRGLLFKVRDENIQRRDRPGI